MKRLAIAALLAGLAAVPAWAQVTTDSVLPFEVTGVRVFSPAKTNLDAALDQCIKNWQPRPAEFKSLCEKVYELGKQRAARLKEAKAAKTKAEQEAAIKAALPIIERGIADPDGKPK